MIWRGLGSGLLHAGAIDLDGWMDAGALFGRRENFFVPLPVSWFLSFFFFKFFGGRKERVKAEHLHVLFVVLSHFNYWCNVTG